MWNIHKIGAVRLFGFRLNSKENLLNYSLFSKNSQSFENSKKTKLLGFFKGQKLLDFFKKIIDGEKQKCRPLDLI